MDELPDGALLNRGVLGLVPLKAVKPECLEVLDLVVGRDVRDLVEGLGALDLVGGLKVLDLGEGLKELDLEEGLKELDLEDDLLDRVGLVTLVEGLLALGVDEDLELADDRLLMLLRELELLLRIRPSAPGSMKQDKAKASVTRAILAMYRYSRVHILLLLSSALALSRQAQ